MNWLYDCCLLKKYKNRISRQAQIVLKILNKMNERWTPTKFHWAAMDHKKFWLVV